MAEVGITAIVAGAILFALRFFPGLLRALLERFLRLRDHFFPSKGPSQKSQRGWPLRTDGWLLGGGGVIFDPRVACSAVLMASAFIWPLLKAPMNSWRSYPTST